MVSRRLAALTSVFLFGQTLLLFGSREIFASVFRELRFIDNNIERSRHVQILKKRVKNRKKKRMENTVIAIVIGSD